MLRHICGSVIFQSEEQEEEKEPGMHQTLNGLEQLKVCRKHCDYISVEPIRRATENRITCVLLCVDGEQCLSSARSREHVGMHNPPAFQRARKNANKSRVLHAIGWVSIHIRKWYKKKT
eukprot:TRINITY_DN17850_c0_g1_i1.p1 TRINITY_DN17850_c0_g1~~TRINITY_DN17850_c0_g1_i1.p1  ORF type:complete len:119 (-),score=15.53 TRINITY_DN17850_c0_g1_i1:12-368(-)